MTETICISCPPVYRFSKKLAPIKAKYPEFSQKMSARFYDSARFFSDEMLFGRYMTPSLLLVLYALLARLWLTFSRCEPGTGRLSMVP